MRRTIKTKFEFEGVGLHTGEKARVEVHPVDTPGIVFVREDIQGKPEIPARVEFVSRVDRGTILMKGEVAVRTAEHILSALWGMGVDSAKISLWGPELPALDGSALPFAKAIKDVGTVEIGDRCDDVIGIKDFAEYREEDAAIVGLPAKRGLEVSYAISYPDTPIGNQFLSIRITPETYLNEIAPARTYVLKRDVESLMSRGLVKGGSLENTVVFDENGLLSGQLRFNDEPVRHKILDFLGDLALLGRQIYARIWAYKTGHRHHIEFVKILKDHLDAHFYDIYDILRWMPHRYPFLLIDRIVRLEDDEVVGYKNVTFNEPFFQGHFPSNPVMPGVLILEAMAQVGGFLLLNRVKDVKNKLLYFSGADKVRFRRPVRPGDRVVFKVRLVRFGGRNAIMTGDATVDGEPTASATMMATLVEREDGF